MAKRAESEVRIVKAVHGLKEGIPDPAFEHGLAQYLRAQFSQEQLLEFYTRFMMGDTRFDAMMRRFIWSAVARRCGDGLQIGSGVGFKHLETFEIGDRVFIGAQSYIQGRIEGTCKIGDQVWIGPQSYFDARHLVIEEFVGWGPGAKVLGSTHVGVPVELPIIQTDLEIKPVRIGAWSDIGTNAVILPGVTIGKGSIVAAGAIVVEDVPPFSVVAGIPARFLHWRQGYAPTKGLEQAE